MTVKTEVAEVVDRTNYEPTVEVHNQITSITMWQNSVQK